MTERRYTPEDIRELGPGEVFVFGSNLSGMHRGGAARVAYEKFGAVWGQGTGLQGRSYGIPTMQGGVETIGHPYRLRHRRLQGRRDCPAVQGRRRYGKCNPAPDFR